MTARGQEGNTAASEEPIYQWAADLFPICRSITGEGVRQTLQYLKSLVPELEIHSVSSGTKAFDWTVPPEWNVRDAYVADEAGQRIIDFRKNNLHLVGYSEPVDVRLSLEELKPHLHSLPEQPDALPYVTSYYKRQWGFCLSHTQLQSLAPGNYRAVVDSTLAPGVLNYGDIVLPGAETNEVLLSTYICHPSMANNEVSGPVVTAALARWLRALPRRRFTYRMVFVPETIGAVVYLSRHLELMQARTIAGFVVTCVGDERNYSFLPSPRGNTLADRAGKRALKDLVGEFRHYRFLDRGSDERQYCSPLVNLPVVSIMRTRYGSYPEYHTSLDDLSLISQKGLMGSFRVLRRCIEILESNYIYRNVFPCEPQLGKYGLKPSVSDKHAGDESVALMDLMAYADGMTDLLEICEIIGVDFMDCTDIARMLERHGLLERVT